MSGSDGISAVYIVVFVVIVALALLPRLRGISFGKSAQMALAWVAIFGGLLFVVAEWPTIRGAIDPASPRVEGESLRIRAREDGHFYVRGQVNGTPALFLVDTGASDVVLSLDTARTSGLDPAELTFDGMANTANGLVRIAAANVEELKIGPLTISDQPVMVNGGKLEVNLLGQRFLNELSSWRVERGELILTP